MKLSGFALALGRRAFITMGVVTGLTIASAAFAQAPAPAAPAQGPAPAAPAPPQDPFRFSADAAAMIFVIKQEKAADFEAAFATIRAKLAASEKPELKELGASLKYFKWDIPVQNGEVTYMFIADPASKTTSYSPTPFLLFDSGLFERAEGTALYEKVVGGLVSANPIPLTRILQ